MANFRLILHNPRRLCERGCAALAILALALAASAQPRLTRTTPELLADAARDYGLTHRKGPTAADVAHVQALLRASLRLDSSQADVHSWLYELSVFAGDAQGASAALKRVCELDPGNEFAFARWLEAGPPEAQTAEKRKAWLDTLLAQPLPAPSRALVHVHLGRLALQRLDRAEARIQLAEARRVFAHVPESAALAIELLTPESPAEEKVAAALDAVRFNPNDAEAAWQAGLALHELGFFADANTFFDHSLKLHRAIDRNAPIPPTRLMRLALNDFAREDRESSAERIKQAVTASSDSLEPALLMMWLAGLTGDPGRVTVVRDFIRKQIAAEGDPENWPVNRQAQAAWFYSISGEELPQALKLAEKAAARVPDDPFVQRALGWAQAANQQFDAARKTLTPLAQHDPFAAYRLIEIDKAAGEGNPAEVLARVRNVPAFGPGRSLLESVGLPPLATPASERMPAAAEVIAGFDKRVLEFAHDPSKAVTAAIRFTVPRPETAQPWVLELSLTNAGTYPITLGSEWMLDPVFLLSARVESDLPRDLPHVLTMRLDRARVLPPGESVTLSRTVDIGPLRRAARQSPQRSVRVSIFAILDPERDMLGDWRPSPVGQYVRTATVDRRPLAASPEAWSALFAAVATEDSVERFVAIDVLAQALGESQREAMGKLPYRIGGVPDERIARALRLALESPGWEARARTLDAMQLIGLDQKLVDAVTRCLSDDHWLVRMLAVRLLARQGPSFADTARSIAAGDADELVRDLARSYLDRWAREHAEAAATQPATAPATE